MRGLVLFLLFAFTNSQEVQVIQTAKYTNDRLTPQTPIYFSQKESLVPEVTFKLNRGVTYQSILGFGGAFTEASGYVLSLLNQDLQQQVIRSFFGEFGSKYSLCRVHINSCDFSLASYSFDEVDGDFALQHFDISHDKEYLIPYIHMAQAASNISFKLYASPWSPPAWMKSNNQMDGSGFPGLKSDPRIHQAWALYFAKFIQEYHQQGIDIWGVTVQNEPGWSPPWEGCNYNASEERDFVRDYLGPILQKYVPDVKIMVCDDQKSNVLDWAKVIFSDPEAAQYIWGTAFHWYDGDHFDNLMAAHNLFPKKNLLATEACDCPAVLGNWDSGEHYAHDIIGDLNNWALGWVHWNMLLNLTGGPNHLNNDCDAPILADPINQILYYQPSYYYMGQCSRFLPPDSVRVDLQSNSPSDLDSVAFVTPSNEVVFILLNTNNRTISYTLIDGADSLGYSIPGHAIQTLIYTPASHE